MTNKQHDVAPAGYYVHNGDAGMSAPQRRSSLVAALVLIAAGVFTLKLWLRGHGVAH